MEQEKVNLYAKLAKMRVTLQESGLVKTGENKFSNFVYFELDDFLPQCNKIAAENNAVFLYQLQKEEAVLTLINCDNTDEKLVFSMPLAELSIKGANGVQNIGGLATYTRRYLYMIALEISEKDSFDPTVNNNSPENHKDNKNPTPEQQKEINDIAAQKIPQAKIHIIEKELERTGVTLAVLCGRYHVENLSEVTEEMFPKMFGALKNTPSKA